MVARDDSWKKVLWVARLIVGCSVNDDDDDDDDDDDEDDDRV
jgi:hypothetical protein